MAKTLKQLLDQINDEAGFDKPNQYIGSVDPNINQLIAIANRSAIVLRDMHLQAMVNVASIDLSSGSPVAYDPEIRTFALPSDFLALVPDTAYQNGRIDMALLPTSPSEWNYLISRTGPEGLRIRCRIEQNRLFIYSPETGETLKFEYLSKFPIYNVEAFGRQVPAESWANDSDVWRLDDALIEMDVLWRYKRAKGLDWQDDRGDFIQYSNSLRARDRGARTIGWPDCEPYPNAPYTNLWVN